MRILFGIVAATVALAAHGVVAQQTPGYDLAIVEPADGLTVFDDGGDVAVRVSVVPGLENGDQVELLLDGLPVAPPGASFEFPLSGVTRGEHQLQARIIDATGNVGSISPSSTVNVWQASLLFQPRPPFKEEPLDP
jgi:hypothetical protein